MGFAYQKISTPSAEQIAALIAAQPGAFWLDSAMPEHPRGRYSIVALSEVDRREIKPATLEQVFAELDARLQILQLSDSRLQAFSGGIVGWLNYESDGIFQIVDTALVLDHAANQTWVFSLGLEKDLRSFSPALAEARCRELQHRIETAPAPLADDNVIESLSSNFTAQSYQDRIHTIKEALLRGDCYQVNLSQKFTATGRWNPAKLYLRMRRVSRAPESAWLNGGDFHILSASPETLLRIDGGTARSFPIKGTRRRENHPPADAARAEELLQSEKDAAELLMIVDLVRNDLGKVCRFGSVHVPELKSLESFPQVHHLVATVSGTLSENVGPLRALAAMFPGGSVTGTPKLKAMEVIRQLEDTPRGIYTGTIGFADFSRRSSWNIAIRTAFLRGSRLEYSAGGGIVVDSDPAEEYGESLQKARGFFATLGVEPGFE